MSNTGAGGHTMWEQFQIGWSRKTPIRKNVTGCSHKQDISLMIQITQKTGGKN